MIENYYEIFFDIVVLVHLKLLMNIFHLNLEKQFVDYYHERFHLNKTKNKYIHLFQIINLHLGRWERLDVNWLDEKLENELSLSINSINDFSKMIYWKKRYFQFSTNEIAMEEIRVTFLSLYDVIQGILFRSIS